MKRREFVGFTTFSIFGSCLLASRRTAYAVPDNVEILPGVEFPAGERVPTVEEILAAQPRIRGTDPPYKSEVQFGQKVMDKSPTDTSPFEVARYFERLRLGELRNDLGPDSYLYGSEWPVRANPVIVHFFDATTLRTPAGDQTPWCAAFVNWCINRAHSGKSARDLLQETRSAASASFRNWGSPTTSPQEGDIVVFRHRREREKGHVGFFVSATRGGVYVLGGNQMPHRVRVPGGTYELRNTGEINTKFLPEVGADLELLSFRTHPSIHA